MKNHLKFSQFGWFWSNNVKELWSISCILSVIFYTFVDGVCECSMMNAVQLASKVSSLTYVAVTGWCSVDVIIDEFVWLWGFCSVIWFHHGQQRVGFMFSQGSSQPWHSMLVSPTHLARLHFQHKFWNSTYICFDCIICHYLVFSFGFPDSSVVTLETLHTYCGW